LKGGKFVKKILSMILVLAMVLTLGLTGCSSTTSESQSSAGASSGAASTADKGEPTVTNDGVGYPDATVELTWLPQEAFDSPNKPVADYLKAKAVEFVKKHPEVKIKVTAQTVNIQDAMAKLLIQASSGTAPDVAAIDSFTLPSYWKYLQPVDDVLEENNISLDSWFQFAQDLMKPQDKVLALWYNTDVRMLYYQKALFPTVPKDWDELVSKCQELKKSGNYSFLYPAGKNETTSCDIWPWFWAQGGKIVDDSGKPVFNEGENKQYMLNTLKFLKTTIDTGITPTRVTSFMTDGDMNEDVASGKVAAFVGGSWLRTQIAAVIGEDAFVNTYEMAPIPVMAGKETTTTAGGWTYGVFSKDDTKRKLAAQFAIDTFVGDEGAEGYCVASGNLPVRTNLYASVDHFKTDPYMQKFKDSLAKATVRPGVEIYNFISTEFQVAISDVISGAATPESALDKMAKNVDAEYAKK
jgi:ABC-type sugar transport system, periplasmic component